MGAFDELLKERIDQLEREVVRTFFYRWHSPARAEVLIRGTIAEAAERGCPLTTAAEYVMAFGMPYDVPKMLTGLRGLIASP